MKFKSSFVVLQPRCLESSFLPLWKVWFKYLRRLIFELWETLCLFCFTPRFSNDAKPRTNHLFGTHWSFFLSRNCIARLENSNLYAHILAMEIKYLRYDVMISSRNFRPQFWLDLQNLSQFWSDWKFLMNFMKYKCHTMKRIFFLLV